jgi:hypothetical protein
MIKVLIIGKKSFLGSNLKIFLSKIYDVDIYSFDELKKRNIIFFENIHSHNKLCNSSKIYKIKI